MIFYQHVPHSVRGMRFCSHERSAFWAENLHEMYVRKRTQKFSKDDKDTVCFWWLSQKSPLMKKPKSQFSSLCKSSLQICKCKRKLYVSHYVKSVQISIYSSSVFSCIQSEYRKIWTKNNSVFWHFSHSVKKVPPQGIYKFVYQSFFLKLNNTIYFAYINICQLCKNIHLVMHIIFWK